MVVATLQQLVIAYVHRHKIPYVRKNIPTDLKDRIRRFAKVQREEFTTRLDKCAECRKDVRVLINPYLKLQHSKLLVGSAICFTCVRKDRTRHLRSRKHSCSLLVGLQK
jgi:hypothetical protein